MCFKGAQEGGRILRSIHASSVCPDFLLLQVQGKGSYRDTDIRDFLDWALAVADRSDESIVVMLDWVSSHRADVVASFVRLKGHILLFHGGGATAFTQVNDTHLHALVSHLLVRLENERALRTQRSAELGRLA